MGLIFLTGMTGSGKSTIGVLLAARLGVPFIDVDAEIEQTAGESVSGIMAAYGKAAFRDLEAEAVKRIVERIDGVVALGGGALERDETWQRVCAAGRLVYLKADTEMLVERLWSVRNRPLLMGAATRDQLRARLMEMLARREARYRGAQVVIEVDGTRTPLETAEALFVELSAL